MNNAKLPGTADRQFCIMVSIKSAFFYESNPHYTKAPPLAASCGSLLKKMLPSIRRIFYLG
jgi:hypothetical protein